MSEVQDIMPSQVKERLARGEKLQIIDVREADEVALGMIPGAKHIRLAEVPDRLSEINRNEEVIFVCRSGGRSGRASELVAGQGFAQVKNMVGGMLAWDGEVK